MHNLAITIATVLAVLLIHGSYIDFRFRYRDGLLWFWLLNPAPPLMWVARASFVLALIAALSAPFIGLSRTYAVALGGLMLVHLVSLVLLEVLEPK